MKVALCHDFLVRMGGAEDVLAIFLQMFPDADVYTLFADKEKVQKKYPGIKLYTHPRMQWKYTFLSHIPFIGKWTTKLFLPLTNIGRAIDGIDLSKYDLVIANSGAWCHGLVTSVDTKFVVYMHSPMRFAWDYTYQYRRDVGAKPQSLIDQMMVRKIAKARMWDSLAEKREHVLICNSLTVKERIQKFYRKNAYVAYPPVRVEHIPSPTQKKEDFFLILSTLAAYKHIETAITWANEQKQKLIIAGDGPYKKVLQRLTGPTVQFTGYIDTDKKYDLLQRARAVLYTSEEDFGIVPIEAAAAGTPCIALGRGGARETVLHGETGLLYPENSVEALRTIMEELPSLEHTFSQKYAREHSMKFSTHMFTKNIRSILSREFGI